MNPQLKSLRAGTRTRRKAKTPCLAELIAWYMERRGWSSSDFAAKARLNPSIISRVLNFKQHVCSQGTIESIAKTIGCEEAEVWAAQRCSYHLAKGHGRQNGCRHSPIIPSSS
jgi:ribosome-binding protein aMBF1 (putative translation factor)